MKTIFTSRANLILILLIAALVLAGCGKTAGDSSRQADADSSAAQEGTQPAEGSTQAPAAEGQDGKEPSGDGSAQGGQTTESGDSTPSSLPAGEDKGPADGQTPAQEDDGSEDEAGSPANAEAGLPEGGEDPAPAAEQQFAVGAPGKFTRTYTYSGQQVERMTEYYIPSGFQSGRPLALMLTLHGSGETSSEHLADGDFVRIAEREGFVVVAPNAVGISSTGKLIGNGSGMAALGQSNPANLRWFAASSDPIASYGVDDVAYLSELIDLFVDAGVADPGRVYVSGLSHGAFMSVRMALEAPQKIAGIGAVAGELCSEYEDLIPAARVKLVFIQGDNDWVVPIDGMVFGNYVWSMSTEDTIAWFLGKYGLPVQLADTKALPDTDGSDGCSVTRYAYSDTAGNEAAVKYVVAGGGHNWPGSRIRAGMGPFCQDVSATELIWNDLKDVRK